MTTDLVVEIGDLVGHPEAKRNFSGVHQVSLRLGDAAVDGPMQVEGVVQGTVDGVIADFDVSASAHLVCVRCLTEWDQEVQAQGTQHFGKIPDEDGYAIVDRVIQMRGPATDELALALPATPVCQVACQGLCPICGTDLNSDPCEGHGEETDSPFAALKDLFDS